MENKGHPYSSRHPSRKLTASLGYKQEPKCPSSCYHTKDFKLIDKEESEGKTKVRPVSNREHITHTTSYNGNTTIILQLHPVQTTGLTRVRQSTGLTRVRQSTGEYVQ